MRQRKRVGWVAIVAGVVFLGGGVALGVRPYQDRRAFENAAYCGAVARDDCVARVPMTVVSRSTYTTEDPDPNPPMQPPPQPPLPPPPIPGPYRIAVPAAGRVLAALPMSTTTHYRLTVRTADGEKHTYEVGSGIYDVGRPGTTGTAEVWRGRIERLRIGSRSDEQWSYWSLGLAWLLAWVGVMLIVGWGLPLGSTPAFFVIGGWWAGVIAFAILHGWGPALWVVPVTIAGVVVLLRSGRAAARW